MGGRVYHPLAWMPTGMWRCSTYGHAYYGHHQLLHWWHMANKTDRQTVQSFLSLKILHSTNLGCLCSWKTLSWKNQIAFLWNTVCSADRSWNRCYTILALEMRYFLFAWLIRYFKLAQVLGDKLSKIHPFSSLFFPYRNCSSFNSGGKTVKM